MQNRIEFTLDGIRYDSLNQCKRKTGLSDTLIKQSWSDLKRIKAKQHGIVISHDRDKPPEKGKTPEHILRLEQISYIKTLQNIADDEKYWNDLLDE